MTRTDDEYVGVAYDPETHEVLGSARGTFESLGAELDGRIVVDDREFTVESREPLHVSEDTGLVTFETYERVAERQPLRKTEVTTDGSAVTGYTRQPSRRTVAFSMQPVSSAHEGKLTSFVEAAASGEATQVTSDEVDTSSQSAQSSDYDTSSSDEYNEINWIKNYDPGNDLDSDGWNWITYLTGYDGDSRYAHDQLPNGEFNRWNLQSFFTEVPSPDDYSTDLEPKGSDYYITCTPGEGDAEDQDIRLVSERPNDNDGSNYSFSVGIGYGFSSVTIGPSVSVSLDTSNTDFRYDHSFSEWDLDWSSFPDNQEENRGVFWSVDTSTDEDQKDFRWEVTHYWNYYEEGTACDPGSIIYESDTLDLTFDVPVVEV